MRCRFFDSFSAISWLVYRHEGDRHEPVSAPGKSAQISLVTQCTISLVSTGPQLVRPEAPAERNWIPLAVAAGVVVAIVVVLILVYGRGNAGPTVTPVNAPLDPYASNLPISNIQMSQSSSLSGSQQTYIDGHIVNNGSRTVTGVTVQVLFQNFNRQVTQNETQAMRFIRMRQPYVDVEPVAAAPLKPGQGADFRLIFESVADDWDSNYPQIRIVHVETR